ncbi:MAG: hypothetical protein QOE46_3221 [Acidobacteriota bacterium]|nr:hypothetical protein [Acidobacteriota bacterium]
MTMRTTRRRVCALDDTPEGSNNLPSPTNSDCRAAVDRLRQRVFVAVAILVLLVANAATASAARQGEGSLIVKASGVRLRERPDTGAAEVGRLQLGSVIAVVERAAEKTKVGASEDYWYLVSAQGGARGWVFGGLVAPFDPTRREEIYVKLSNDKTSNASATFAEMSDLVRFLDRAVKEVTRRDALGELELARLVALAHSLASFSIQDQEKPPYKSWTAEHEREIVYSEPSGQWLVRADLFWNLQRKYRSLPLLAERAAWEAAQTPLPGECEGYLPCHLGLETMTNGNYLELYPRGAHANAALANIAELLGQISEDLRGSDPVYNVPREDRADFHKLVATLRTQIALTASPKKAGLLKQLEAITRRFP